MKTTSRTWHLRPDGPGVHMRGLVGTGAIRKSRQILVARRTGKQQAQRQAELLDRARIVGRLGLAG